MARVWCFSALILLGFAVSACNIAESAQTSPFHDPVTPVAIVEAPMQAGDRLHVTVFGEDKLTGDYDVDAQGQVTLPLLGRLRAAGATPETFGADLTARLRKTYLRDPKVSVGIVTSRPFYILGEVEKPGEYTFKTGLNIWRAIAVAGGQTYRASSSSVLIQHAGEQELREYDLSRDVAIRPGDLIRVPERWF